MNRKHYADQVLMISVSCVIGVVSLAWLLSKCHPRNERPAVHTQSFPDTLRGDTGAIHAVVVKP